MAKLGDPSFSFASVWNSISNDIRCASSVLSFKSILKHTYFVQLTKIDFFILISVYVYILQTF